MPRGILLLVSCGLSLAAAGCQSAASSSLAASDPAKSGYELADFTPDKIVERTKRSIYGSRDEGVARKAYAAGEELFQKKEFDAAREEFETAAFRWPDSQLEEDAMFMVAECNFFADRYPDADAAYNKLLKKHGNSEHIGTISRRRFAMGRYWLAMEEKDPSWWFAPNFTDKERPLFDTPGRAVKAYESIMLTDPRGPLSDDAIMAVADAMFNQRNYEDADFRYKMIITDYPQSKYQYDAHERSLRCKLLKYQGPDYDHTPLYEAEELVEQMLTQFPERVGPDRERLLTFRTEIPAHKQTRDLEDADYYARLGYNYAARQYYARVVKEYPKSNLTEQAVAKLEALKGEPDSPEPPFAWAYNWTKIRPAPESPSGEVAQPPQIATRPGEAPR